MSNFKKWQSINKFSDAYFTAQKFRVGRVECQLKIKLHGTNAGIRLEPNGQLVAQKRTSDVFVGHDNAGWAGHVSKMKRTDKTFNDEHIIVWGEWAGKGVQKTDAVSLCDKKFYVFAIENVTQNVIIDSPYAIQLFLDQAFDTETAAAMVVIPYYTSAPMTFNFSDQKTCQHAIDWIVAEVDKIEACDPFIKELYGVEGPGEGLVGNFTYMEQQDGEVIPAEVYREYTFKVKSLTHSVQKNKDRTKTGPEKPEGVDEFISMFFTEARFRQMLDEHCGGEAHRKHTGVFMKAVMSDVHKESKNEIEVADFEWKIVPKFASSFVRQWLFDEADKL